MCSENNDNSAIFLQEKDFHDQVKMNDFIKPLAKYLKNSKTKVDRAICYRCKSSSLTLQLYQVPTLQRLSDEIIETHNLCKDCVKQML